MGVNVCWINGGYYQRRNIIDSIKGQFKNSKVYVYDEDSDVSAEFIRMKIIDVDDGIFGDHDDETRIIILKSLPKFNVKQSNKKWAETFLNCSDNCAVIIDNVPKSISYNLYKKVEEAGAAFDFKSKIERADAVQLCHDELVKNKYKVDDDLARYMIGFLPDHSGDYMYDDIISAVNHMMLYMGKEKKIKEDDIKSALHMGSHFSIWDIFDIFDNKQYCQSHKQVKATIDKSKSVAEAIELILAMSRWRYRMLMLISDCQFKGMSDQEIVNFFKGFNKTKYDQADGTFKTDKQYYSDGVIYKALSGSKGTRAVDRYTRKDLYQIISLLDKCMFFLRTNINETSMKVMCDLIIMRICEVLPHDDISYMLQVVGDSERDAV